MVAIKRNIDLTGYSQEHRDALANLFGQPNDAGVPLTVERCYGLPAFLQGMRLIATSVGRIDCEQFRIEADGGRTPDLDHPNYDLLNFRANPFQNSDSWKQAIVCSAICKGSGYGLIQRDDDGYPQALYNIDAPVETVIEYDERKRVVGVWYLIRGENNSFELATSDDVIHIRNVSIKNGLTGVSVIDQLRNPMGKALAIQKFQTILFKNGNHTQRFLKIPGWLTPQQKDELKESIADFRGLDAAHRVMPLFGGSDMTSLPVDAQELQMIEASEASDKDIANILGLSCSWVGGKGYTSYGSLEQDNLNLLSHTVDQWLCQFESEFMAKLLLPSERRGRVIEFNRSQLTQGDSAAEATANLAKYEAGVWSFEEYRRYENKSGKRDGHYIVPQGLTEFANGKPVDPPVPPVEEAPPEIAPETPPVQTLNEQPPAEVEAQRSDAGQTLYRNAVERIRTRITRAARDGKPDLQAHHHVIRDCFDGLDGVADRIITSLDTIQDELRAVLPEQAESVISRWIAPDLDSDKA